MTDFSPVMTPVDLLKPLPSAPSASDAAKRSAIAQSSKAFESSFLSSMLGHMFEGISTAPPFGGGPGETAFKSFMMDAMAKQISNAGGIGVAASIQREMLKLQGMS
jgi:flagellar protein FlgJ